MKLSALAVSVGLLLGITTLDAGAARVEKTYEGTYEAPGPGGCAYGAGHNACLYGWDCRYSNAGCALVDLKRPATRVEIEITDQSGRPVLARVHARGGNGPLAVLCAMPGEPYPIDVYRASELIVHIVNGTCEDSTPSTPTRGIVRVTRI